MFDAAVHAGPVYRLLGTTDLGATDIAADRDGPARRRARLPPARGRPHHGPELADLHRVRPPVHPGGPRDATPAAAAALTAARRRPAHRAGAQGAWVGTWPVRAVGANLPPSRARSTPSARSSAPRSAAGACGSTSPTTFGDRAGHARGGPPRRLARRRRHRPGHRRRPHLRRPPGVTIPPGGAVTSDPVAFPLAPLRTSRSRALRGDLRQRRHWPPRLADHLVPRLGGDAVSAPTMPDAARTDHWYVIAGLDVERGRGGRRHARQLHHRRARLRHQRAEPLARRARPPPPGGPRDRRRGRAQHGHRRQLRAPRLPRPRRPWTGSSATCSSARASAGSSCSRASTTSAASAPEAARGRGAGPDRGVPADDRAGARGGDPRLRRDDPALRRRPSTTRRSTRRRGRR